MPFADRFSHIFSPAAIRVRSWSAQREKKEEKKYVYEEAGSRRQDRSKYKASWLNILKTEQFAGTKNDRDWPGRR